MKIETLLAATGLALFINSTDAAFLGTDEKSINTVAEALKMSDDTPVILEGNIVKHIRKDKYLFTDETGEITLEISEKDWNGVDVRPTDKVRIIGETDKDWWQTEINVSSIKIIR